MGIKLFIIIKQDKLGPYLKFDFFNLTTVKWCFYDLPANPEHNTAMAIAPNPNSGFCSTCNSNVWKWLFCKWLYYF